MSKSIEHKALEADVLKVTGMWELCSIEDMK